MNLNIGIDIGASSVRMVVKGRGLVLNQSCACALKNGKPEYLGDEAFTLWGRERSGIEVVFPMCAGTISREDALEAWLGHIIANASSMGLARVSRVLIAKPPMLSLAQSQRYAALAMRAGAAFCALMPSDILMAVGEGIDISKPRGAFVMNIGAGHMSASVIVRSSVVSHDCLGMGLDWANDIITRMIRDKYTLRIGPGTAEAVKRSLYQASPKSAETWEQFAGFDLAKGFPGMAKVDSAQVRQCVEPLIEKASQLAISVIDKCEPQVQADILQDGASLSGGGAHVYGIAEILSCATGVAFKACENPELSVAAGLEKVLDNPDEYEKHMEQQQTLFDKRTPGR